MVREGNKRNIEKVKKFLKKIKIFIFGTKVCYISNFQKDKTINPDSWANSQAKAIAHRLINGSINFRTKSKTSDDKSLVFGISGKWGVGKTYLIEKVEYYLGEFILTKRFPIKNIGIIKVDPWKYAGDKVDLLFDLSVQIQRERKMIKRLWLLKILHNMFPKLKNFCVDRIEREYKNKQHTKKILKINILYGFLLLAASIFAIIWLPSILYERFSAEAIELLNSFKKIEKHDFIYHKNIIIEGFRIIVTGISIPILSIFLQREVTKARKEKLFEFESDIRKNAKKISWPIDDENMFLVVLENLDRLKAQEAMATLDIIRSFFNYSNFTFVIAGDLEQLEVHIGNEILGEVQETKNKREMKREKGRDYLKKLYTNVWTLPKPPHDTYLTAFDERIDEYITYLENRKPHDEVKNLPDEEKKYLKNYIKWQIVNNYPRNFRDGLRAIEKLEFQTELLDTFIVNQDPIIQRDPKRNSLLERLLYVRNSPKHMAKIAFLSEIYPDFYNNVSSPGMLSEYIDFESLKNEKDIDDFITRKKLNPTQRERSYLSLSLSDEVRFVKHIANKTQKVINEIPTFLNFASLPESDLAIGDSPEDFLESLKIRDNVNDIVKNLSLEGINGSNPLENYAIAFNAQVPKILEPNVLLDTLFTFIKAVNLLNIPDKQRILIKDFPSTLTEAIARLPENSEDRLSMTAALLEIVNNFDYKDFDFQKLFHKIYIKNPQSLSALLQRVKYPITNISIDSFINHSVREAYNGDTNNHRIDILLGFFAQDIINKQVKTNAKNYPWIDDLIQRSIEHGMFPVTLDPAYTEIIKPFILPKRKSFKNFVYRNNSEQLVSLKNMLELQPDDLYQLLLEKIKPIENVSELEQILQGIASLDIENTDELWDIIASNPKLSLLVVQTSFSRDERNYTEKSRPKKNNSENIFKNILEHIDTLPIERYQEGINLLQQLDKWIFKPIPKIGENRFKKLRKKKSDSYNQYIDRLIQSHNQ